MNEYEAFRRAIELHRNGDWKPAAPNWPQLKAGARYRTIQEICELIINSKASLPEDALTDLLWCCNTYAPNLTRALRRDRTYSAGAACLLALMSARNEGAWVKNGGVSAMTAINNNPTA